MWVRYIKSSLSSVRRDAYFVVGVNNKITDAIDCFQTHCYLRERPFGKLTSSWSGTFVEIGTLPTEAYIIRWQHDSANFRVHFNWPTVADFSLS